MPLCMCSHEDHEHGERTPGHEPCFRPGCPCEQYRERPATTTSFTDLPVSQGARDLYEKLYEASLDGADALTGADILAAADEKDVRSLLWARRVGKL